MALSAPEKACSYLAKGIAKGRLSGVIGREIKLKFFVRVLSCLMLLSSPLVLSAEQLKNTEQSSFKASLYKLVGPASSEAYWYFQTSVWTSHFNPKPEHNNRQRLIGIERNRDDSYLWGAATFLNSFEQRSHYAYAGKRFDFGETPFYSKITGGLLHGYKGEYRDKIPFNRFKIAPVILPSLGMKYSHFQTDIILLGANAVIVTIGIGI